MARVVRILLAVGAVTAVGVVGASPRAWAAGELACCVCSGGTCGEADVCVQIVEMGAGVQSCPQACDERCGECDVTSPDSSCDQINVVDYQEGACLQLAECRPPAPAPALRWPALMVSALALAGLAIRQIERRRSASVA